MAEVLISIVANTESATANIENFGKKGSSAFDKLEKSSQGAFGKLKSGLSSIFGALTSLQGIFATVISGYAIRGFISASNEQEKAQAQLAQALGRTSTELLRQASALQRTTTFGDEQIIQAQARIAMFVKDEEQIKAATKATLDFAAAKGMDLVSAADLVSKAIGTGTNALARYGIEIEKGSTEAEKLAQVVAGLTEHFGGQAEALRATGAGGMDAFANSISDIQEALGDMIKTIIGPLASEAAPVIQDFAGRLQEFFASEEWKSKAESIVVAMKAIIIVIGEVANATLWATDKFVSFGEWLGETAAKIVSSFENAVAKIKAFPSEAYAAGKAFVDEFIKGIKERAAASYEAVKSWLKDLRDYLPFSPAKIGPLVDLDKAGMAIPQTLAEGITANKAVLTSAIEEISGTISGGAIPAKGQPGVAAERYDMTYELRDREIQQLIAIAETQEWVAAKMVFWEQQKMSAVAATAQFAGRAYGLLINNLALLVATGKLSAKAFGAAMFEMAADAVIAVGQQAAVKAVFALAEGFLFKDPAAFKAAALYAKVAAIAGTVGIGLKATAMGMAGGTSPAAAGPAYEPYATGQGGEMIPTTVEPRQPSIVYNIYVEGSLVDYSELSRTLEPYNAQLARDTI